MFKLNKNYLLISIILLGLSGCAEKRVIVIKEPIRNTYPRVTHANTNESVKEEILIKNNPNLGNRMDEVEVPRNYPTLDIKLTTTNSSGLNGQTMERMPFHSDEYRQIKKIWLNTVL